MSMVDSNYDENENDPVNPLGSEPIDIGCLNEYEDYFEFMDDSDDVADEVVTDLVNNSGGRVVNDFSNLVTKLQAYPEGGFPVSVDSSYREATWNFPRRKNDKPCSISFNSSLDGSNDLKRIILYYLIPEFHPFGRVRSYETTKHAGSVFKLLDHYLFAPNNLRATPAHIKVITEKMVNDALEDASNSSLSSHYENLYFLVRLWLRLSKNGFIPDGYCLELNPEIVDSHERRKSVWNHIKNSRDSWKPFSENELESLINYSIFWTQKAMPALLNVKEFIKSNELDTPGGSNVRRAFQKKTRDLAPKEVEQFAENFNITIEGATVLKANITKSNTVTRGRHRDYVYQKYSVTYARSYNKALNQVRNGVFILVALLTGMRRRELAGIRFEDIAEVNGEFTIDITRYKTSTDPNYLGEKDTIPIPKFVGKIVSDYKALKDGLHVNSKGGKQELIFASSNHKSGKKTYSLVDNIIAEIKEDVFIDMLHAHRFRKTIAEILINRDERNIDIIRLLFGHKSYAMALKYIARNPYLVQSVVEAIEYNSTDDLIAIVSAIKSGAYSGQSAERIASTIANRPDAFSGKQLKVTIHQYVSHLLSSGEPFFIHRTALGVGTYCVSHQGYSETSPPLCHAKGSVNGSFMPDRHNCQIECNNLIVLEAAKTALWENIKFYKSIVSNGRISQQSFAAFQKKIAACEVHLKCIEARENIEEPNNGSLSEGNA